MNMQMMQREQLSARRSAPIDRIAGFVTPLALFVEYNNYLFRLTTASGYEEAFAVPISLLVAPFFFAYAFTTGFLK